MPPPRDEARIQVVAFEVPADNAILIAVGGVEGSHRGINGDAKFKEKIPEQNKFKLNNLNLKDIDSGKERQIRRSSWLRKGLIEEVNEFGKRRVSWQRYRGDKQAVKWVAHEDHFAQVGIKGMDKGFLNPMHLGWVMLRVAQAHRCLALLFLRQGLAPSIPKINPTQVLWA